MNPMPELIPMLKQLRLSGILDSLESRNRQAIEEKLSYMDFLATIIQDEIARRTQKKLASALRRAYFRNQKTLDVNGREKVSHFRSSKLSHFSVS